MISKTSEPENAPRRQLTTGIMHFGPGAFHRAHQADYVDRLLADDRRWGIGAVSLRSSGTIEALRRQVGRYTLSILAAQSDVRTLSAHSAYLGPGQGPEIRRALGRPAVKIVSSTVTEKGYCLDGDGTLNLDHPDIVHDLTAPHAPRSLIGWLALGLADRREAGLPPFTTLCCDNLASNGSKLAAAVQAYAERIDPELARWIAGEARFPDTMVDSITPATTDALRARVLAATGFDDAIPVSREAYSAWVIGEGLGPDGPDFAAAGAVLTPDVGAWERAKLRLLNGAHSTLAYLGLLLGHRTVADAMSDRVLSTFSEQLMTNDIAPTLAPSPLNLRTYIDEVVTRFRNPAVHHLLAQIAGDGSQKLPHRLLDTLADARAAGRPIDRLAMCIAAWIAFIRRQARSGAEIVDPMAALLTKIAATSQAAERLLALQEIFPATLMADDVVRHAVLAASEALETTGPRHCLSLINKDAAVG